MDYYSFNQPRRDGWLSWPCWLTDSGCFTHKVVTRPAVSLAQVRESSPARTGGLTTMLRHQLGTRLYLNGSVGEDAVSDDVIIVEVSADDSRSKMNDDAADVDHENAEHGTADTSRVPG